MAMGNRPEVQTAPAPIAALDVSLLAQQLATALARVPFRRPFEGPSSLLSNLGISVTREVIRSFMGYASSLRIPEFRSLELVLDEICQWIMPPVRPFPRRREPRHRVRRRAGHPLRASPPPTGGRDPLPPRRRVHRHVADDVRVLHGAAVPGDRVRDVRRRLSAGARVPLPGRRPRTPRPPIAELVALGIPRERIFLAGDSGGGGLANTLLLERPEHLDPVRPGGLGAVLARSRSATGRALRHRERGPRHPAVEHPDDRISPRDRCLQPATLLR